ncbi:hypothetical protein [Gaetbulibacter jejuensis]|uniref:Ppx/GppA phosphatase family protein n=1 Tax=Gaetbulibacter jejuensis TaxID=584607 RepID=UPI0030098552
MEIQYNRDRYIVIVELSSTAFKILKLQPRVIDRKSNRHEINRYKSFTIGTDIGNYIEHNQINITSYKKHILPTLVTEIEAMTRVQPSIIRILATGYYRTIGNTDELVRLIESSFPNYLKTKGTRVEVLTPDEESYLSYLSWECTYLFSKGENLLDESKLKLNIDVGGGTTELTVFRKPPFKNTISLQIGVDHYMRELLDINDLHSTTIWYHLIEAKERTQAFLNENIPNPKKNIDFAICTGSTLILDKDDETNDEPRLINVVIGQHIFEMEKDLSERIQWKGNKKIEINNNEQKSLRKLFGLIILNEILKYFGVYYSYNNLANLRIGAFHQTKQYLEQLHRYKI